MSSRFFYFFCFFRGGGTHTARALKVRTDRTGPRGGGGRCPAPQEHPCCARAEGAHGQDGAARERDAHGARTEGAHGQDGGNAGGGDAPLPKNARCARTEGAHGQDGGNAGGRCPAPQERPRCARTEGAHGQDGATSEGWGRALSPAAS